MIAVRPYAHGDLDRLRVQPGQAAELMAVTRAAPDMGPSFTALDADKRLLFVGGFAEVHPGYASAWAVFAADLKGNYIAIAKALRRVLDACSYARVDTLVRDDWARAHDLAKLLGFDRESVMAAAGPGGEDFAMYVRIKRGRLMLTSIPGAKPVPTFAERRP